MNRERLQIRITHKKSNYHAIPQNKTVAAKRPVIVHGMMSRFPKLTSKNVVKNVNILTKLIGERSY